MSDDIDIGGTTPRSEPCRGCGSKVYPCRCIACPQCDGIAKAGLDKHECTQCSWREDDCECGTRMVFDPKSQGRTCGGMDLVGWLHCPACGETSISFRSRASDAGEWKLAKGGRSIVAGAIKVRCEATGGNVEALMARIVRVPELEAEIERLQEQLRRRAP